MRCSQDLLCGMHSTEVLGDRAPTFRPHFSLAAPTVISDDNYTGVILLGYECPSIKRILDAAAGNLAAHCTLALIIPLGYSCLCTSGQAGHIFDAQGAAL